ncbi:hypothetical protein A4H97_14150 [Niastella yeongjuensis]|uniref:Uncharacterized protein n=1 Tax=Niastella yeongjuensis TaxID=354355 RepID=A0A1V9E3P8_9BACT|nr:hypothetical protein [Niastella yeongjuensis]OQP40757.1 hypothetical protein A4H97_14150 [Niastella yeongjuensis]SEP02631.1 hypothetical protein SAMN05660816_04226 [Niastella yeongjuensis]
MIKRLSLSLVVFHLFLITSYSQNRLTPTATRIFDKLTNEFHHRDTLKQSSVWDPATRQFIPSNLGFSKAGLDSIYKPIFGRVMFGSGDLVNQGSAYALTVNQFETQFSMNYNWMANKKQFMGKYYNLGFAASSSSKTLPVFSKDEWQQGFTLSFGVTQPFRNTLSYDKKKDFPERRRRAMILSLKEVYQQLLVDSAILTNTIHQVDTANFDNAFIDSIAIMTLTGNKNLADEQAKVDQLRYLGSLDSDCNEVKHFVDSSIAVFEQKYFKDFDYGLWWFNILLRPEYKGINLYDTTAARIAGVEKKNFFRFGIEAYINHVHSGKNLFLFQGGVGVKNSNYLEGRKPEDVEFSLTPEADTAVVVNKKGLVVTDYDKYKKAMLLITPSAGFNWFWGEKRRFGWETFFSAKLAIKDKLIPFDNVFTVRTGLLISLNGKSDLAKSTFGLLTQWEDVKFKSASFKDGFTFSVRIGIPFNF